MIKETLSLSETDTLPAETTAFNHLTNGHLTREDPANTPNIDQPLAQSEERSEGAYYQFPASFAQERLWFIQRLDPSNTAYNPTHVMRVRGSLNVNALQQSVRMLVERHESLRTTFQMEQDQVVQRVATVGALSFEYIDCQTESLHRKNNCNQPTRTITDQDVLAIIKERRNQPFDLAQGPLFHVLVFALASDHFILAVIKHHIITDAWSSGIFWRELSLCYRCLLDNLPVPLPELPIQYADFAIWQREWLQGDRLAEQLTYWKNQLAALEPLSLPTDYPRPLSQSHEGASIRFELDPALSHSLKKLSQAEGVTLFATLLAAFQTLLMRYSGTTDIAVGSPIANRSRPELEGIIGLLLNTQVLRSDLSGNPSFREILGRVHRVVVAAHQHQDMPFEKLVQELQPERMMNRSPLFQVMFSLNNAAKGETVWPGLQMERLQSQNETTKGDLMLNLTESREGLRGTLVYDTSLFEAATIQQMLVHFEVLLEGILTNPDQSITELPLLTQKQRKEQLVTWNNTLNPYPKESNIHEQFETKGQENPDAIALNCADGQLSYRELNQRANQLAHLLQRQGVQFGDIVAICSKQSAAMIIAMLAILKTGAAYLPLDPSQPMQRLLLILEDARAKAVIADSKDNRLQAQETCQLIDINPPWEDREVANISAGVGGEAPAYIIYTSGSTSKPKGVVIPHRAVLRLVCNTNYINITPQDGVAQASNPMFDAATFEIWGALLNGARLVGVATETLLSPAQLSSHLNRHNISILFTTTALFHRIADLAPKTFQSLRVLLFGGETVDPRWARRVSEEGRPQHLLHVYGPTENCTFSSFYPVEKIAEDATTIPIGKPIANTQTYILDANLQPVPIGVIGELHIGGDGLAHGYLHQPELSTEKFVSNPFGSGLLYKSGDMARYLADGSIEFIGRRDFQVKIRGFRVELGEVESAIHRYTAVKEAVVLTVSQGLGEKQLLAYIVPHSPGGLDESSVDDFLRQRLPSYMVPSEIVILDSLPLNSVGKVDRNALQQIRREATQPRQPTAARDLLESQLVEIWESVLNKKPIGIRDNFFNLGGHSLLAVQLFDRIAKLIGQTLPLATLFQTPTIEALATALRRQDWSPNWNTLVPIRPQGSLPPLFVIPPGASTVLRFAPMLNHLDADLPIYGLQHRGLEDENPPFTSVAEIAEHFVKAILSIQPTGPYLLTGICFGAHVALEIAQRLRARGATIALLAVIDASPPANGPNWNFSPLKMTRIDWHLDRLRMIRQGGAWIGIGIHYLKALKRRLRGLSRKELSHKEIRQIHRNAQITYQADYYAGSCILLQSEEYARREYIARYWKTLISGRFETCVVPGSTHSSLLLSKYHLQLMANALMKSINQSLAQS